MLRIIIDVDTDENIIGVKEDIAYYCEKYGDVKLIAVGEVGENNDRE